MQVDKGLEGRSRGTSLSLEVPEEYERRRHTLAVVDGHALLSTTLSNIRTRSKQRHLGAFLVGSEKNPKKGKQRQYFQSISGSDEERCSDDDAKEDPVYMFLKQANLMSRSGSFEAQLAQENGQAGSVVKCDADKDSQSRRRASLSTLLDDTKPAEKQTAQINSRMTGLTLNRHRRSTPCPSCIKPGRKSQRRQQLQQKYSVETPDGVGSSSSLVSPNSGSVVSVAAHYVALRDHVATCYEEIDFKRGDLIAVHNQPAEGWWHGTNLSGKRGSFPPNYVAPLYAGERIFEVTENLQLCEGSKSLRLFRDQIVFGLPEQSSQNMMKIRTADEYRALCPKDYLATVFLLPRSHN